MSASLIGRNGTSIATEANPVPCGLPATATNAGYNLPMFEQDTGTITGAKTLRVPDVSPDHRLSVGTDTVQAVYNFTATAQNTGDFKHAFTTMTMTQSGGFLNINPALATVSGNYASLQSWRYFTLQADAALHSEEIFQITAMPPTNQFYEHGFFVQTAGVAPADGAFFRLSASGLVGVVTYNGTETQTAVLAATVPINTNAKRAIVITQTSVEFWLGDVLGEIIPTPAANAVPYLTMNLPYCMHVRNSNTVTGGCQVKVGSIHVTQKDIATNKPWAHQAAGQGNAYQGQEGDTMGSLAVYSNAALAAAAALVNTSAAAQFTGLGGVAQVLPTLTAGTDGILFSYQNPVGSITQPPKTLYVTGVRISSSVNVVLVGGPLCLVIGVAYGHTAVSLATTESASFATGTTKAPRRVPFSVQNYIAAAAAGSGDQPANVQFASPIVVNPGEFFQITCRNVGVVTTTGSLVVAAMVDHYFE